MFDHGIVQSVDNFGVTGDRPSHPELLDHLSRRFIDGGWSVKKLVRAIVLSRTYQLSSNADAANLAVDPANRLLWRHSPRRLSGEEIRDAMLAGSETLDLTRPKASPAKDLKVIELPNNGPLARKISDEAKSSTHRSVYLPLLRGIVPISLEVFDFAEQGMVSGHRSTTTVPPQALYLLNDIFVRRNALKLAESILRDPSRDDSRRIADIYLRTLGRGPRSDEVARALAYLSDYESSAREVLARTWEEPSGKPVETPKPATANKAPAGAAAPVNPDEVIQADAPVQEEILRPADARTAAWASFCQVLFGSAEFRYVK